MRAEPDQPDRPHRQQTHCRARRHPHALARARRDEHQEGERETGGELDAHPDGQRARAGTQARVGPRGQRKGQSEDQQQQCVVVRPAHGEHEQRRVQPDERRRPTPRASQAPGGPRDQRHRAEARRHGHRLQRPKPAGEPERGGRVAREREQGSVGGGGGSGGFPSEEREDRVGRHFGGRVRVWVQAMQGSQAGEAQVAEHVLGEQRRPQEQDHVGGDDRRRDRAQRKRSRREQHDQIAPTHDQHPGLEASLRDPHTQALQRAGQPVRPAAVARGDVDRRPCGGASRHQEDRGEDAQQPERAERAHEPRGRARARRGARIPGRPPGDPDGGYGGRGLYGAIVASPRPASVQRAR